MRRLGKCARRKAIINVLISFILVCIASCSNYANNNPSFASVFEAYKWLGYEQEDSRTRKIMELLHNCKMRSMTTGVDSVPYSEYTGIYNYAVCCTDADFKRLNFVPLSKKHKGIAYIREIDEYYEGVVNDTLKIYFPDSLQSKAFFDDAVRFGFRKYSANDLGSDSVGSNVPCTAGYTDTTYTCVYFICLSEKDKNVVIFNCCP